MKKIIQYFIKFEKIFYSLVLSLMVLILFMHVSMRYLFNSPLVWTDEVSTLIQGGLTFIGISYCFRMGMHTRFSLLYDRVPTKVKNIFNLISDLVMLACSIIMIKAGVDFVSNQHIQLGTIGWIYKSYFYIFVPIGFLLCAIYLIGEIVKTVKRIKGVRE